MSFITVPFEAVASGTTPGTYKTIAALELADAQENRYRLRAVSVGPDAAAPQDENVDVIIKRIADVSAGGVGTAGTTIAAANIPVVDDEATPPVGLEANINYSAEPTVYETNELFHQALNARGAMFYNWEPDAAPVVKRDQLLGLLVSPADTSAITLSGSMLFESF